MQIYQLIWGYIFDNSVICSDGLLHATTHNVILFRAADILSSSDLQNFLEKLLKSTKFVESHTLILQIAKASLFCNNPSIITLVCLFNNSILI